MDRLLEMGQLPNVSIEVVPLSAAGQAALEYPFTLLYIARARALIAYTEGLASADYLARPQHTQTYSLAFESARRAALSPEDTADLLQAIRSEL